MPPIVPYSDMGSPQVYPQRPPMSPADSYSMLQTLGLANPPATGPVSTGPIRLPARPPMSYDEQQARIRRIALLKSMARQDLFPTSDRRMIKAPADAPDDMDIFIGWLLSEFGNAKRGVQKKLSPKKPLGVSEDALKIKDRQSQEKALGNEY